MHREAVCSALPWQVDKAGISAALNSFWRAIAITAQPKPKGVWTPCLPGEMKESLVKGELVQASDGHLSKGVVDVCSRSAVRGHHGRC